MKYILINQHIIVEFFCINVSKLQSFLQMHALTLTFLFFAQLFSKKNN